MSLKKLIKEKFGYDVSELSAWTDETQQELITRQVTEARTLQLINIQEGVKGTMDLHTLDDEIIYQDASACNLTPSGDSVLGKAQITTVPIGWMKGFCNKDLNGFWAQVALRAGAMAEDKQLPFEQAITNYLLQLHALELDKLIWKGDTALSTGNLSWIDGFDKRFNDSAAVNEANTLGYSSITNANAFEAFWAVYEAASDNVEGVAEDPMFRIFTSQSNVNKLIKNMFDLNLYHFEPGNTVRNQIQLGATGITIEAVNTTGIYAGKANHLTFGTDLKSDSDSYELWYSQDDDQIYVRSKFRAGVQVPFLNEITKFTLESSPA